MKFLTFEIQTFVYFKDLDTDHYALEKVKRRILEYLAVRQLKNSLKGNFFTMAQKGASW